MLAVAVIAGGAQSAARVFGHERPVGAKPIDVRGAPLDDGSATICAGADLRHAVAESAPLAAGDDPVDTGAAGLAVKQVLLARGERGTRPTGEDGETVACGDVFVWLTFGPAVEQGGVA
ncbi:MAG: hypothetical protein DI573_12400 [Microbacterium sp.]|nr:MAG: hypothetical protein DI573_12400 [Microbacterium sp.]